MNRILVALDATEQATFVLTRAIELARLLEAKLRLLHVVPIAPELPVPGTFASTAASMTEASVAAARARLYRMEDLVPDAMRDGIAVEVGTPANAIEQYARNYDPMLVVIGAHAHGALARILGTTAARVVNRADRPVLVVRDETPVVPAAKTDDTKPAGVHRKSEHTMLEAATITGGVVGTTIGAIAGPPGAIAGGAIGTAVGMLAGIALDNEGERVSLHDRELDTDIGVTSGDLGARELASEGLTYLQKGVAKNGDIGKASQLLRAEHERLEAVYDALVRAYRAGDWNEVRARWDVFEAAIRDHMAVEEERVFPLFKTIDPEEAKELLAEHAELRRLLSALGVAIDLHAVPGRDIDELIARVRSHAAREAYVLYPWIDETFGPRALQVSPAA